MIGCGPTGIWVTIHYYVVRTEDMIFYKLSFVKLLGLDVSILLSRRCRIITDYSYSIQGLIYQCQSGEPCDHNNVIIQSNNGAKWPAYSQSRPHSRSHDHLPILLCTDG
jgi:hypothetical protein